MLKRFFSLFKRKKPYYRYSQGQLMRLDIQFFAAEDDDLEDDKKDDKPKGEDTPEWGKSILNAINNLTESMKSQPQQTPTVEVPVPKLPDPPEPEDEEMEDDQQPEQPKKKSLLEWFW